VAVLAVAVARGVAVAGWQWDERIECVSAVILVPYSGVAVAVLAVWQLGVRQWQW
jgi:DNA-binding IclR family transcriptional regulator